MNETLASGGIGPAGEYGNYSVGFVSGKLNASLNISLKGVIDSVAKKIGGPWAESAAKFIESAVGLE